MQSPLPNRYTRALLAISLGFCTLQVCTAQATAQGFGTTDRITAKLVKQTPPDFPLFEKRVAFNISGVGYPELATSLSTRVADTLASRGISVVNASDIATRIDLSLSNYRNSRAQAAPPEQPKATSEPQSAADNNWNGFLTVTCVLREPGATQDSKKTFNVEASLDSGRATLQIPDAELLNARLVDNFISLFTQEFFGGKQEIEVPLPVGSLREASLLGQQGRWFDMFTMLTHKGPLPNQLDESYRLYSLGVTYEAVANLEPYSSTATGQLFSNAYMAYSQAYLKNPKQPVFIQARSRVLAADGAVAARSGTLSILQSMQRTVEQQNRYSASANQSMRDEFQKNMEAPSRPLSPSFPWPPPPSTSMQVLPEDLFKQQPPLHSIDDANHLLLSALESKGYVEHSYYSVPGGFALVTRIEQIDSTGAPLPPPDRWALGKVQLRQPSLQEWAKALFNARPGFYRVIVFVISNKPFSQSGAMPDQTQARQWITEGSNVLDSSVASTPIAPGYNCTALIYEFRRDLDHGTLFVEDSAPDARTQLKNAGIWSALSLR
ncbi:hypothetical protein [Tunturiibacter gelidoferens]|uniref:Uncharacterized protein n=1 Tax=Tunturiibacter gelidiferens TaxID=3069689 RepID=A0ACC5NZY5_9BACT|nr:hypothetical protein [Edaphobacter lichenicola]MBB5340040.1 hypothetical protein [Edaphobacter lichenicola]